MTKIPMTRIPMSKNRWISVAIGLSMVAGSAAGVLVDRLFVSRGDAAASSRAFWFDCDDQEEVAPFFDASVRARKLEELTAELTLSTPQVEQLDHLFDVHSVEATSYWNQSREEFCSMRDKMRADLRGLLDPSQQTQFEAYLEQRRARAARQGGEGR